MNNKSVPIFEFLYPLTKISIIGQKAPEWGPVKIYSNLRKVSLLKLSNWVCLPGKIMLCTDYCTTVGFTDFTFFSLFLFEFPANLVWSSCDNVTIGGKRFHTVAADSGFSSFLMLNSTANFSLKKNIAFCLQIRCWWKQVSKSCEKTRYWKSFENVIVSCFCFWCVYLNMKMVSRFCCCCCCQLTKCWIEMRTLQKFSRLTNCFTSDWKFELLLKLFEVTRWTLRHCFNHECYVELSFIS